MTANPEFGQQQGTKPQERNTRARKGQTDPDALVEQIRQIAQMGKNIVNGDTAVGGRGTRGMRGGFRKP